MSQKNAPLLRESYQDVVVLDGDGNAIAKGDTTLFFRARRGVFRSHEIELNRVDRACERIKKLRLPSGDDVELIDRRNTLASNDRLEFDFFYRNGEIA